MNKIFSLILISATTISTTAFAYERGDYVAFCSEGGNGKYASAACRLVVLEKLGDKYRIEQLTTGCGTVREFIDGSYLWPEDVIFRFGFVEYCDVEKLK